MAANIPFQAQGRTYKANATTTSQRISILSDSPCNQLLVANHQPTGSGGQPVYFLVSANASITVTAPDNNNASYSLVSIPGSIKSYTIPQQFSNSVPIYIAFIGAAASECFFTPGEGI
jgi:hypothetical protein